VDGNGLISLMELDWDEAHELGKFRAKVLQQYPSCVELARIWGMTGVRRYHVDDFTGLLLSWGFAETPAKADKLFRMLCGVPVGGETAGFLGRLGPLKDSAPAVTSREFRWLDSIGEELPVVSFDRVMPGDLGMVGTSDIGDVTEEEQLRMRIKANEHQAILKHQEEIVFERLYDEAMEHVKRFKCMGEPVKEEKRELADPMLYERLYNDYLLKKKRHDKEVALADRERQQAFNHNQAVGSRKHDTATIKRITKPRKRHNSFNLQCQARKEHLLHLMNIEQLMHECDKRAQEIRDLQNPNFEWKSFGKSRRELLWMLETNVVEHLKEEKPVPSSCGKLYKDAEKRSKRLQTKLEEQKSKKEQEVLDSFRCDLHKDHRNNCNLCKRWQAVMSGQREKKSSEATERLWNHAQSSVKSHIETRESTFKTLIDEADKLGMLHDRSLISARVALEEHFKLDARWELAVGRDRDRLIIEGIDHFTRLRRAAEAEGLPYNPKVHGSTETFFRLFLDGNQRRANWEEQRAQIDDAMMMELEDNSVHRDVPPNPNVFEQLYSNQKREGFDDDPEHQQHRLQARLHAERRRKERRDNLAQSRSPGRTPRTPGYLDELPPTSFEEDAPMSVFMMYFQTVKWRPPAAFESQLKIKLQEYGAGDLSNLNCRIRQANSDGIVVQLTGPDERVQDLEKLPLLSTDPHACLHCMKHKLTRVWSEEGTLDPLGEFVDFLHLNYDHIKDAFAVIDTTKSGTCTRQEFLMGLRKLGFFGDSKFIWHALEGGNSGTLSAATFGRLSDAIIKVNPEPVSGLGKHPSKGLLDFFKQLSERHHDPHSAFEAVNLARNGKLLGAELQQACKQMKMKNVDAKAIFRELDIRVAGVVLMAEWTRAFEAAKPEDKYHKIHHQEEQKKPPGAPVAKAAAAKLKGAEALMKASQKTKSTGTPDDASTGKVVGDAAKRAQSAPAKEKATPAQNALGAVSAMSKMLGKGKTPPESTSPSKAPSNYEPDSEPSTRTPGANTPRAKQRASTPNKMKAAAAASAVAKLMPPKSGAQTPQSGGAKTPREQLMEVHARTSVAKRTTVVVDADSDQGGTLDKHEVKEAVEKEAVKPKQKAKAAPKAKTRPNSAPAPKRRGK